ncbi:MAG: AI-2E family transporter [Chitinophagales bacterium]|nr:AI-2E family transporter [Chitinophagales bacterium]
MIAGLAAIIIYYLSNYLGGILGALVMYIIFRNLHFYLTEKRNWKKIFSILIILLIVLTAMILPAWWLIATMFEKATDLLKQYEDFLELINYYLDAYTEATGIDILTQENIQKLSQEAGRLLSSLLSSALSLIGQMGLMFITLFFMLLSGRDFERWVLSFTPFSKQTTNLLLTELKRMTYSNAIGIPLLAFAQGMFAFVGYKIAKVDEALLWGFVTGLFSLLPLVGTALIWMPITAYVYFTSGLGWALFLFAYGLIVISNVDNLLRLAIQKAMADIHPMITFLGVLIGLQVFGITGIIFGPLLITYFLIFLKIYRKEYGEIIS